MADKQVGKKRCKDGEGHTSSGAKVSANQKSRHRDRLHVWERLHQHPQRCHGDDHGGQHAHGHAIGA